MGTILNYKKEYEKYTKEVEEKEKEGFFSSYSWEKVFMIIGAIIGTLIILYVMFWLYRNCRRQTSKYHIELNEQYDTITEKAENYLNSAYKSLTNIFKEKH